MDKLHTDYLNRHIKSLVEQSLRIEAEWLTSIAAPVKQLPDHIAEAVFNRYLFEHMPPWAAKGLMERVLLSE
jgi:hypothetical protein